MSKCPKSLDMEDLWRSIRNNIRRSKDYGLYNDNAIKKWFKERGIDVNIDFERSSPPDVPIGLLGDFDFALTMSVPNAWSTDHS